MVIPSNSALLVIDVQLAIDDPVWAATGPRNNPAAERNIARLLAEWRSANRLIVHIRHDSLQPGSTYRPGQPGHRFKPEALPLPGEPVIGKTTNSAFIGTQLENLLESEGVRTLFVAGAITNNSVEATVRMAGNLGFDTWLIGDACFTFAKRDYDGRLRTAEEVHAMSLANLEGEYCRVVSTDTLLSPVR